MGHCESPHLFVAIVDRGKRKKLENILHERNAWFQYRVNAVGTARSEVLNAFGLVETEKTVGLCIAPRREAHRLMTSVAERMELMQPGHGIAFTAHISGESKAIALAFEAGALECTENREGTMEHMELHGGCKHDLVLAIVNTGYSEEVMAAARSAGARGGTIVHARQSEPDIASRFFGIALQPDKELVLIVIERQHKVELMKAVNKACGMHTGAHGLLISLPVDSCAGLTQAAAVDNTRKD